MCLKRALYSDKNVNEKTVGLVLEPRFENQAWTLPSNWIPSLSIQIWIKNGKIIVSIIHVIGVFAVHPSQNNSQPNVFVITVSGGRKPHTVQSCFQRNLYSSFAVQ